MADLTDYQSRLKILLPEEYRERYDDVQPTSMGSAGLKYDADGRVAWNDIWGSFCDLAMAGGPPHRGKLLEPATAADIALDPVHYREVTRELCRGIALVTRLIAEPSTTPGWIHIDCPSVTMAGWLARAITMENVSAHCQGMVLYLPAGPQYRVEKEIKNVITSIAKTAHYWIQHTSPGQHRAVATLLATMDEESPLIQIPLKPSQAAEALRTAIAAAIQRRSGLIATGHEYPNWLGIECQSIPAAISMMRIVVAANSLCRREDTSIYVPINAAYDNLSAKLPQIIETAFQLAR